MTKRISILAVLLAALAPAAAKEFAPLTIASGRAEQYTVCHWTMEDGLPENDLRALSFDPDGFLWCVGTRSVSRFDGLQFSPRRDATADAFQNNMISAGTRDWMASFKAMLKRTPAGFQKFPLLPSTNSTESITTVVADGTNRFWLAAGQRILRFEQETFTEEKLPPDCAVDFQHLAVAHDGTLWAASGESLFCRRQGGWAAVPVPEVARGRRLGILALYAAPDGALWVGTESTLYQVRYGLWPEALLPAQLPIRGVKWICSGPDGSLWLAGRDGLRQLRRSSLQVLRAEEPPGKTIVNALAVDAQGRLLAGVANVGLMQTQPTGGLVPVQLTGLPERLPISALAFASDGSLWVGTQGDYLWHWHDEVADPFYGPNINALLVTRDGRVIAGADDGLKIFDTHRDELVPFSNITARVNVLLEERSGRICVGTQNDTTGPDKPFLHSTTTLALCEDTEGLVWKSTTYSLRCRSGGDLLYPEFIAQILDDNRGNLWLGLKHGLACIRKADLLSRRGREHMRTFGVNEGYPAAGCISGTGHLAVRTSDGKLCFATRDGIAVVDPWRVAELPAESLRVFIEYTRQFKNEVQFEFTAPCYTEPEALRFSWQLEGFEKYRADTSTDRRVSYQNLPPEHYRFKVWACLNGVESQSAETVIIVAPLFWQTWWWRALTYAAGVAVAVLVALGLYRWRVRRQQQLDRLRLRIARDLHDEIGSNLGGIALLIGVAEHDPDAFERIRAITLQSIEALKDLVWMIDPGHDALPDMLLRMRGIADDLLPGKLSAFTLTGDATGRRAPLEVRRNVLPIFKEALHNIIKHAQAQHVTIEIALTERRLTLTIRDDGVGMDPAAAPGGHGLRNMQRRAEDIGGQLKIESQPGAGTVIHLEAPLA
jgi:signal transduction histidine kinase/ligand-binding sensor domain-containing protein